MSTAAMQPALVMGSIRFGPHRALESHVPVEWPAGKPITFREIPFAGESARSVDTPQRTYWLLELFTHAGVPAMSRGLYWAGRSNRVENRHGSVEVTTEVTRARKIPLECAELAFDIASALNKLRDETNRDVWSPVKHISQ